MHLDVSDGQGVSFLPVTNHSMHDQKRLLPCFEINFPSSWWGPHAELIFATAFLFRFSNVAAFARLLCTYITHQCANGRNVRLFFFQRRLSIGCQVADFGIWHMEEDFIKKQKPIRAQRRRRIGNVELKLVSKKKKSEWIRTEDRHRIT